MSAQAGWYPDPSGNADKLRFWDGNQWTSDFMDAPASAQEASQVQAAQAAQAASQSASESTPVQSQTSAQLGQATSQQGAQAPAQFAYAPAQTHQQSQSSYQQPAQSYQQPNYGTPAPAPTPVAATTYAASSADSTLRLVAFVFDVLTIITCVVVGIASFGIGLIPLAWVIPMTVMTWHVYQGKRANTIALGVCTLLFISLVSGILLLCSTKEK